MHTRLTISAAMLLFSFGLLAQPNPQNHENHPPRPKMETPQMRAKHQADIMKREVGLNDKQYKKVYKLFKSDFEYRDNLMKSNFEGMPPVGGPGGPGMGGPGMGGQGGPGMVGPGMGGPGMGGPGMGGPGMGGPGMGGGRPPQGFSPDGGGFGPGPGANEIDDAYFEKQDKKLRKILSPEQHKLWRAKHPMEHQAMPPIDFIEKR